jgi:hypothetical protein
MRNRLLIVLIKPQEHEYKIASYSVRDLIGELLNSIISSQDVVPNRVANKLDDKRFNKSYEIFSKQECKDIYIYNLHKKKF